MRETFEGIREGVRALCAGFPGDYWRRLDEQRSYPEAFVAALTEAGYLAALIPEAYGGSGLPLAAAAARSAATDAYDFAAKENIQTHGGIGFTWEADTQFHYRRSRLMALSLGGPMAWKDKLVSRLEQKNAA